MLSTSSDEPRSPEPPLHLAFDAGFGFLATQHGGPLMPRLAVVLALDPWSATLHQARPVLDTGAEYSVFDGAVALSLGWTGDDLVNRAFDRRSIQGVAREGAAITGYLHELVCYIPLGRRHAQLQLCAFLTPPSTLWTPVLGRRGFFDQVDFALVEAEQRFSLRFRDPGAIRPGW